MNTPLLVANILTFLAFTLHAFIGDKELKLIEPKNSDESTFLKQEKWTMARCGWHWVSFDLLFISIGLSIINFTDYLSSEQMLLDILTLYFVGYGIVWLLGVAISKRFPKNYFKLGQWMLLWLIAGLIYMGQG